MLTLVSGDELAELTGVSASTIRRYARDGTIPAIRSPGGHRQYDRDTALAALALMRTRIRDRELTSDRHPGEREKNTANISADDAFANIPPTPRGPFITATTRLVINETPQPSAPVLTPAEWDELVEVLDGRY